MFDLQRFALKLIERLIVRDFQDKPTNSGSEERFEFFGRSLRIFDRIVQNRGLKYVQVCDLANLGENRGDFDWVVNVRCLAFALT